MNSLFCRFTCALFLCLFTSRVVAASGDEHWSHDFGWPGSTNSVLAMAVKDERVYVSGYWSAGPLSTNNWVEVWDGTKWSALPGVFDGSLTIMYDALFVGTNLYVCGLFSRIDGQPAQSIARWNGQSWSSAGDVRGIALTMATDGTNLYVGGSFTNISSVSVTNVAKWNGQTWSSLGAGLGVNATGGQDIFVRALTWHQGGLVAGGSFVNGANSSVSNLARWTGTDWISLNGSPDGSVTALASHGANLYAGGGFSSIAGVNARSIAQWNGAGWFALGSGLIGNNASSSLGSSVAAIGVLGGNVIVGGSFTNAGGMRVSRIARWDGGAWHSMGAMNDTVETIRISGTNAYVGGPFTQADDYVVNHVARWDGTRFHALGRSGRSEGVAFPGLRALAADGGRIYAGGLFTGIGRVQASRVACWDGTNWARLGTGLRGINEGNGTAVNAIAAAGNGDVYVGGVFTNAGGVTAHNIARWNGVNWFPVGNGIPGTVSAIAVRGSEVFVGGTFTTNVSGGTAFNIAKWNGSTWSALPGIMNGTIGNFVVTAITVHNSDVYVGGNFNVFNMSSGQSGSHIARHDGTEWVPLGTGMNSNVTSIVVVGSDVYAGGRFSIAGGVAASRIARWNGSAWSSLGTGLGGTGNYQVSALAVIGSDVYAAGNFTSAGGLEVNRIAKWNGISWSALGNGMTRSFATPSVLALAARDSDLFVGGNFEGAGGKPAYYIAQWNETRDFDTVPYVHLRKPGMLPDRFRFSTFAVGVPVYVVEMSTNLTHWSPILTNSQMSIPVDDFTAPGKPQRFYRARPHTP